MGAVRNFALLLTLFVGCENVTSPDMAPLPDPLPPPAAPIPPPFNPGPTFSWDNVRGALLFPGTQGSEPELRALISQFRTSWPHKQLAFNVCSETAEWGNTPWNEGPPAFSVENRENLERFLRVTADEGVMVYLNIFCTVRDNPAWMAANAQEYTETVVEWVGGYQHVLLSVSNEPWHHNSWLRESGRVRRVRDWAREAGWADQMGADDNIGCDGCSLKYAYRALGFTPNFHPYRNPDPSRKILAKIAQINGLPTIISEPTAYSEWREGRCCTADRAQIERYMRRAEAEGLTWFYHSTYGLSWPEEDFGWIPNP